MRNLPDEIGANPRSAPTSGARPRLSPARLDSHGRYVSYLGLTTGAGAGERGRGDVGAARDKQRLHSVETIGVDVTGEDVYAEIAAVLTRTLPHVPADDPYRGSLEALARVARCRPEASRLFRAAP
jgi:hypothetical protein